MFAGLSDGDRTYREGKSQNQKEKVMNRLFAQICAVIVLFVISLICFVGTCTVFEYVVVNYYKKPVDFGVGAVVMLFATSMVCIFLCHKRDTMSSSISAAYQSPPRYLDTVAVTTSSPPDDTEEGEDDERTN